MFLTNIFIQIAIIALLIIIFLVVYVLNHRIKASKGEELPEKCETCASLSCMIKLTDVNKIKDDLKKELDKCDNINLESDRGESDEK